jgi:hypothetical protein
MTQPNRDLDQAGHTLQHVLAHNLTAALEHLARELHNVDGFPERGESLGVQATSELTSTERAADVRFDLRSKLEDLRDAKAHMLKALHVLNDEINEAMRMRVPKNVKAPGKPTGLCDQTGKEGAIEWGDPLCPMPAVKGGMCQAHYFRWYRHRQEHGIDVSNDHQPV